MFGAKVLYFGVHLLYGELKLVKRWETGNASNFVMSYHIQLGKMITASENKMALVKI